MIDIMVAILLDDAPLSRSNVTALFIQIKYTTKLQKPRIEVPSDDLPDFFSDKESRHPYIAMTVNLGIPSEDVKNALEIEPSKPKPKKSLRSSTKPDECTHPRYAFRVNGCSSASYGVIESGEGDPWTRLLHQGGFLKEHPRQDRMALEAVERLGASYTMETMGWAKQS